MLLKETYRQIDTLLVVMRLPSLYGIRVERRTPVKDKKVLNVPFACMSYIHFRGINSFICICCSCELIYLIYSFHFSCKICAELLGKK